MPKLYEYLGIIVMFYSNEHQPIHVHGKCQNRESKAEIIIENGVITDIKITEVKGKNPLENKELKHFKTVVEYYKDEIIKKWIDFFVYNKTFAPVTITTKLD